MAVQTKVTLKTYFQTGDKPTQGQFGDLIDSLLHVNEIPASGGTAVISQGTYDGDADAALNGVAIGEFYVLSGGENSNGRAGTLVMRMV